MSDLKEKRVELILQQLEELPTLPAVAVRVLEMTGRDDAKTAEVVKLIQSDPALTARILQLVHRADVGIAGHITSVERAVVLLGFEAVRSAVLAVSVFETFRSAEPRPVVSAAVVQFDRTEFWKHCVAVACAAEMLADLVRAVHGKRAEDVDPAEAFVCGLLHDLGKIALDAMLPKSFGRVVEAAEMLRGNIADVERTVIGLDHMVVGKRLAERWQLPVVVRDCIWLHGQTPAALPAGVANPRMVNLITLADLIVREQHLGYSGNHAFSVSRASLAQAIGISNQHVDHVLSKLVDTVEPRAVSLGLGVASTGELYQQALAQANRELGRISGQLATKNRKLAIRAKFFDALAGFQGELRPDAAPQVVLHAVGQTAVAALEIGAAAVFSLPPGREYAEVVLVDGLGDVFETSLIDCGQRPTVPSTGDGPILTGGADLEWMLSAISPRLSHDHRFWICLQADGACIGGVIWGAPSGESQRLSNQVHELTALASGWALALRTAQIRDEAKALSEQLAEANRQLQNAQSEMMRSKTMISVGEMAAGAAHEMNNPLAVISGRSQLLASQLTDPKFKAAAHLVYDQAQRLSDIITELMDFAKPTAPKPVKVEPAELLNKALYEAKALADPADRVIEVTTGEVPDVTVDGQQVTAALVEVIANAIQATDEKSGQIDLHLAFDPYSQRVVVTVTDNGSGMDEVTLRRAFDPFFSSKPAGRRRGMGLAKALRWVESSGGSIRLESRLGSGTRTIVLLPAAKTEAGDAAAKQQAARKQA